LGIKVFLFFMPPPSPRETPFLFPPSDPLIGELISDSCHPTCYTPFAGRNRKVSQALLFGTRVICDRTFITGLKAGFAQSIKQYKTIAFIFLFLYRFASTAAVEPSHRLYVLRPPYFTCVQDGESLHSPFSFSLLIIHLAYT